MLGVRLTLDTAQFSKIASSTLKPDHTKVYWSE